MINEIDITIHTQDTPRVNISDWYDGGARLEISVKRSNTYAFLTRDEAQQLLAGLQAILSKEVTA